MVPWWLVLIGAIGGFAAGFPWGVAAEAQRLRPFDSEEIATLHARWHGREDVGPEDGDRVFGAAVIALRHTPMKETE